MSGSADDLLELALDAHGGLERWQRIERVSVRLSSGGIAFAMKGKRRTLREVTGTVSTDRPHTTYAPFSAPNRMGVFEPDRVRLEDATGTVVAERRGPRACFQGAAGLRRKLWWDHLDLLYFAGYALWNYLTFPFLLTRPGFELSEGEPWEEEGERWRRLDVRFPTDVPTHSREQSFLLDERGRLRRNDYTAYVFGSWAKAAHYCYDHREVEGIPVPTRRRVHPRLPDGRPVRAAVIVWIDFTRVDLHLRA